MNNKLLNYFVQNGEFFTREIVKATLILITTAFVISGIIFTLKFIFRAIINYFHYINFKKLLLENEFQIIVDSKNNKKFTIKFNKDKTIDSHNSDIFFEWSFSYKIFGKNTLTIKQKNEEIYGRFTYYPTESLFGLKNEISTTAQSGQYIEKKSFSFDETEENNTNLSSAQASELKQLKLELNELKSIVNEYITKNSSFLNPLK